MTAPARQGVGHLALACVGCLVAGVVAMGAAVAYQEPWLWFCACAGFWLLVRHPWGLLIDRTVGKALENQGQGARQR